MLILRLALSIQIQIIKNKIWCFFPSANMGVPLELLCLSFLSSLQASPRSFKFALKILSSTGIYIETLITLKS